VGSTFNTPQLAAGKFIYRLKIDMQKKVVSGIEETIIALFDEFSNKYHYYDEMSKNIHYYNG